MFASECRFIYERLPLCSQVPILMYMKYVTHKYGDVQKASNISLFELTIPIKSVGKDKGVLTGSIVHS